MKWILSISLIILLSCVSTLNGEYKKLSEKKIQSMIAHMTKIRNFLRKLEDSDTSGEDETPSDDGSSQSSEDSSENDGDTDPSKSTIPNSETPTTELNATSTEPSTEENTTTTEPTTSPTPSNPPPIPEPVTPTTVLTTARVYKNNRHALVQVLKFHSFKALPGVTVMTFGMIMFFQNYPPKFYTVTIVVHHRRGFRNLADEVGVNKTSNCTLKPEDVGKIGENVRYDCEAPKSANEEFDQVVVLPDFKLEGETPVTLDQLSYSEQAAVAAATLQAQTQEVANVLTLKNGEWRKNSQNDFLLIGYVQGFGGKEKENQYYIQFTNSDESKSNVRCSIEKIEDNNKYTFLCTPLKTINGTIHQADIFDPYTNDSITLDMEQNYENIYFQVNDPSSTGPTVPKRNNPIYRKSSSGLSGGAIAGIVIACAVVLIIGSVIAMMMRKPQVPLDNSASVVGLRTVDNYSQ